MENPSARGYPAPLSDPRTGIAMKRDNTDRSLWCMEQRSKLGVSGEHSSDSNDGTHQACLFLSCSARRGPGAADPRKVEIQQDNGKSEIGKNWNECLGRKEDTFGERSAKNSPNHPL